MDNASIAHTFIDSAIVSKAILLANADLRIEPVGTTLQLWAKHEGMIASAHLGVDVPCIIVKEGSRHTQLLQNTLLNCHLLPVQPDRIHGFYQYEFTNIPRGYQVKYQEGLLFLQDWWHSQQEQPSVNLLKMLLWHQKNWHPIRAVECKHGMVNVSTWSGQIDLTPGGPVVWLLKTQDETELTVPQPAPTAEGAVLNEPGPLEVSPKEVSPKETVLTARATTPKQIGNYLVEAGLLSSAQVDVVLCDQTTTSMRFGEIVASRGWLKAQTIEYLMQHLIAPRQQPYQTVSSTLLQEEPTDRRRLSSSVPPSKPIEKSLESASSYSVHDRETLIISMPLDERTS